MILTSTSNPQIKAIRKLRERKERQQTGLYFIEGLRIVTEAVQQAAPIQTLIVAPELLTSSLARDLLAEAAQHGTPILEVSEAVFASLSQKEGPQGLAAVLRQQYQPLNNIHPLPGQSWVILDSVQDPGNLGTILRTHDAVGGTGVILLDQSTDAYDPTAMRASMGALFSQCLARASLNEFQDWLQTQHLPVIGTSDKASINYHGFAYPDPLLLLMGSERQGLQPEALRLCQAVVRIPMQGRSDSLNLAVATALVLYEAYHQRRKP
jgi:TrmH family RNA methyltransferase